MFSQGFEDRMLGSIDILQQNGWDAVQINRAIKGMGPQDAADELERLALTVESPQE